MILYYNNYLKTLIHLIGYIIITSIQLAGTIHTLFKLIKFIIVIKIKRRSVYILLNHSLLPVDVIHSFFHSDAISYVHHK